MKLRWTLALSAILAVAFVGNASRAGTIFYDAGSIRPSCVGLVCTYHGFSDFVGQDSFDPVPLGRYEYQLILSNPSAIPSLAAIEEISETSFIFVDGVKQCCDVELSDGMGNSVDFQFDDDLQSFISTTPTQTSNGWIGYLSTPIGTDTFEGIYFDHAVNILATFGTGFDFFGDVIAPTDFKLIVSLIPEPTTWALLIMGVGFVGAAARKNRRLQPS